MKYIRTKDGIYEINWFDADNFGDEKGDIHSNCEIIEQANTIEELCDEFVDTSELKTTNTGGWLYDEFDDLSKIYGAIWTDKGLQFVARMNSKGEFELL